MQKTAITKKIEKIKGNNSAKKLKLKILKKTLLAIHNRSIMLKFEGSMLNDVVRTSATKFRGLIGRHFEIF